MNDESGMETRNKTADDLESGVLHGIGVFDCWVLLVAGIVGQQGQEQ